MKVGIYARVSTKDRQEVENQLRQLREFAAMQGWTIYREYIDHETGKTDDRAEFQAMFREASQRKFDMLLFRGAGSPLARGCAGNPPTLEPADVLRRRLLDSSGAMRWINLTDDNIRVWARPEQMLQAAKALWPASRFRREHTSILRQS